MVYLDNAATALPQAPALTVEEPTAVLGNPGSPHAAGRRARELLDRARERVAAWLGLTGPNVYFCSGATEAANLLLQGWARRQARTGRRPDILLSAVEHPCVYETAQALSRDGFRVQLIHVDHDGRIDRDHLHDLLQSGRTGLVAIMAVNNEVGTVQDIGGLAAQVKSCDPDIFVLCDAVQAVGKVPLPPGDVVDALFFSGHKLDGATRCGAFSLNPELALEPLCYGGGQEGGLRPGTEDPTAATRLAAVLGSRMVGLDANDCHVRNLRDELLRLLRDAGVAAGPTIALEAASPYVLSLALEGVAAGPLIEFLDRKGICVSRGSACASSTARPSRVLQQIGCRMLDSVLRISFAPENTLEEVANLARALGEHGRGRAGSGRR